MSYLDEESYYLRWNATDDYELWWETEDDRKALYRDYKYHTNRVLEWGAENTEVSSTKASLRMRIANLHDLASRKIPMPPRIHQNLQQAIALREAFQTFVQDNHQGDGHQWLLRKLRNLQELFSRIPDEIPGKGPPSSVWDMEDEEWEVVSSTTMVDWCNQLQTWPSDETSPPDDWEHLVSSDDDDDEFSSETRTAPEV